MGVICPCLRGVLCLLGLWSAFAWAQPAEQTHTVQRKETVYGIARQYGVDLNQLLDLNRWAEGGIRKGDVLRIPRADAVVTPAPADTVSPQLDADKAPQETGVHDVTPVRDLTPPSANREGVPEKKPVVEEPRSRRRPVPPHWPDDTVRVVVFLPFSAGEDSLSRQAVRLRDIAQDCVAGIRLALDSGRWLGADVDVRFLDTGLDTAGVMLSGPEDLDFGGAPVDIAVGPLRRPALKAVREWPGMGEAVHLALTDLGTGLAKGAPGLLVPYTRDAERMATLAQHVAALHPGERVMMLASGDIRNLEAEDAFRKGWTEAKVDSTTTLVEVEVSSRALGSLRDSLSDVRRNILVVPGGKASRSFAGVLQTEIQLGDTMDFLLYADGSWRTFDFLDAALRDRVRMTVADGTGSRPDSSAVAGGMSDSLFAVQSRRMGVLRGGAVSQYGWLAHDALRDVLAWTAAHGRTWPRRLAEGEDLVAPFRDDVGAMYRFDWSAMYGQGGGLVNAATRLLRQENLRWIEIEGHE